MLVLAGPGSGKTTVITERVRILTDQYRVPPENILVITFTKAAAQEMKSRFLSLMKTDPTKTDLAKSDSTKSYLTNADPAYSNTAQSVTTRVSFGTFHSVFFTILKTAYGYTADNILREDVRYQFFRDYIHIHAIDTEDEQEFIRSIVSEISLVKNQGIPVEQHHCAFCGAGLFRELYLAYGNFLRENRKIDFDDMLTQTLDLFEKHPAHLAAWRKKFPFILVDEFQDINRIQYRIVQMLAAPGNNLFIVGDDDQSIYRFRGANPQIMLDFTKDYPDAEVVYLPVNYRSDPEIIRASQDLIRHNSKRYEKRIQAAGKYADPGRAAAACGQEKESAAGGQDRTEEHAGTSAGIRQYTGMAAGRKAQAAVVQKEFTEQRLQNLYIVGEIRRLLHEGVEPSGIAVLSRTNTGLDDLAEQLSSYNIFWQSKERVPSLYGHWVARDIFTYIHIARGEYTRSNFLRIMNRPNRYLSRELLPPADRDGHIEFAQWIAHYSSQPWMADRLKKLQEDLKVISHMRPYSAVNYIRRAVSYDAYIKAHAQARNIPYEDLLEILEALMERAKGYETIEAWEEQIARSEAKERARHVRARQREDAVTLATYHGAKGLEYRAVFLPDLCEGICPYKKAVLDEDLEEERRMLYVAMTRAKERLYLLTPHRIRNKDTVPSGFLREILSTGHLK